MYVRVKRQKVTIFLHTEPQESVLEVKAKLQEHLDGKVLDPADMKLVKVTTGDELDDAKSLADLRVQNDDVLGLCYKIEGTEEWEAVNIAEPPALQ